jgi:hypothetical protein
MEQPEQSAELPVVPEVKRNRPVILTMLCLASLVFFGFLSALFLAGVIWNDKISAVMAQYQMAGKGSFSGNLLFFLTGFFLHGLAFTAIVMILWLRKAGYYLLGTACLAIAGYQMYNPSGTVASTVIYILFILSFGVFFRRLH